MLSFLAACRVENILSQVWQIGLETVKVLSDVEIEIVLSLGSEAVMRKSEERQKAQVGHDRMQTEALTKLTRQASNSNRQLRSAIVPALTHKYAVRRPSSRTIVDLVAVSRPPTFFIVNLFYDG